MKGQSKGKGEGTINTQERKGYRCWLIGDKPMTVFEFDESGEEYLRCCGLSSVEFRLRGDTAALEVKTKGDWWCAFNVTDGERLDNTPVEFSLPPPLSVTDELRRLVRDEFSRAMERQGLETFEESLDFDVDEDDWRSPYEVEDMVPEFLNERGGEDAANSGAGEDEAGTGGPRDEPDGESDGPGDSRKDPAPNSSAPGEAAESSASERRASSPRN